MEISSECPLCHSPISQEKFAKVTGIWKTIQEQEKEFKKRKLELEQQRKKILEQIKDKEKKWQKEKEEIEIKWKKKEQEILKKAEQEILKKVENKHKKEITETEKKAIEKGKAEHQKKIDVLIKNTEKLAKEKYEIEKKYREAIKEGKTIQEKGFDFEKQVKVDLEKNFLEDKILPKGKKGDILQIIIYKGREICRILYECKMAKWDDKYVTTLKEAVLFREGEYGIIITSDLKKGKGGFCSFGDNIFAVNPEGVIDFVKFLRDAIIKIESLKITQREKNILMNHLWDYMDSSKFGNSINEVIDKAKELKEILNQEKKVHERIWDKRIDYYDKISKSSLDIRGKVEYILNAKKKIPIIIKQEEIIKNAPLQIISIDGETIIEQKISDKGIDYHERIDEIKKEFPNAYEPWEQGEDDILKKLYSENKSVNEIAQILKRQPGAIKSRLKKWGLLL
ncbi:MAG: hypothetical protein Q7S06_02720 [Nanoarchaeota archaeon]|nr:hypothetical protein [Nanoarchaeota archaeon]